MEESFPELSAVQSKSVVDLSAHTIADLPLPLRTRIVSAIDHIPIPPPPADFTLETRRNFTEILPHDLVDPAWSGFPLTAAVADALGTRAAYITNEAASGYPITWIFALAPYVKAVSCVDLIFTNIRAPLLAVAWKHVALKVLHIGPLYGKILKKDADSVEEALVDALRHNAPSLRELGLPVREICANALKKVDLPALQVIQFEYKSPVFWERAKRTKANRQELSRMIRAVGRESCQESCVTELRLLNVFVPPFTHLYCSAPTQQLVHGITKLHVVVKTVMPDMAHDEIVSFIALFSGLRTLHWTGFFTFKKVQTILDACPSLDQIHLRLETFCDGEMYRSFRSASRWIQLSELFVSTRGKLRTFYAEINLYTEDFEAISEHQPNLEQFGADLVARDIDKVAQVLASCRKIRVLDVAFRNPRSPDYPVRLGAQGWRRFFAGVRGASTELCDLTIRRNCGRSPGEKDIDDIMSELMSLLEWMGDRARSVRLEIGMGTNEFLRIVDCECMLMDTAACHNYNLEELHLILCIPNIYGEGWRSWEEEEQKMEDLFRARKRLRLAAPRLHKISLSFEDDFEGDIGYVEENDQIKISSALSTLTEEWIEETGG